MTQEHQVCNNCMNNRASKCFGQKQICSDFRFTGILSKEDKDSWNQAYQEANVRLFDPNRRKNF
jgi:hypothetical protein